MRALVIDNFAGGGGASTGIESAIGRAIDVAINHDAEAVAMHLANHPDSRHFCQSIMAIDPLDATDGAPVALVWFSPDCKHHSKAKGGKPREKNIRDLAWIVPHWPERLLAATRGGSGAPSVIMLENVEEFRQWGPLDDDGMPIKERRGEEFDLWTRRLKRLGYKLEWRELRACDYGAPTSRKRLYLIARRDGRKIVWPTPTHGKPGSAEVESGKLPAWRAAAECIDWSIACPSIFDRKRPLKEATHKRIAAGVMRYVVNAATPFIVTNSGAASVATDQSTMADAERRSTPDSASPSWSTGSRDLHAGLVPLTHHGSFARTYPPADPFVTITGAHRGELATIGAAVVPITHTSGGNVAHGVGQPLRTITTAKGGELAGVTVTLAPHITKFRGGAIGSDIGGPMPTITANGNPARPAGAQPLAYAQAVLAPLFVRTAHGEQDRTGKKRGRGSHAVGETFPTVTASQDSALLVASLAPVIVGCGGRRGQSGPVNVRGPYPTATAKADACLVTAAMVQMGYGEREGQAPRALNLQAPLGTIVAGGVKHGLVTAFLSHFYTSNTNGGQGDPRYPAKTITSAGQHHAVIAAHMEQANAGPRNEYLAGRSVDQPTSTVTATGSQQRLVQTTMVDADALPPAMLDKAVQVAAFLIKYYGATAHGQSLEEPLHAVTSKARFAVVTVAIDAVTYVIVDIGMRMLTARELANAQGFPADYILDPIGPNGKPLSKSAQIRMIGNSVCPDVAEALVRANLPELCTATDDNQAEIAA